jgi:hypothetical protein
MAMNTWSPYEQGGFTGGGGGGGYGGYGGDINPEGAADDPFAYTKGSLLTPWEGRFSSAGKGGGYQAPAYNPFSYADINYNAPSPGRFTENYADPAAFRFADFAGPSQFQAPTEEDMQADPGYKARMNAAMNSAKAAGASSGVLRTGGFVKGLQDRAQDVASQEYGNVYGRKKGEWDTEWNRAKDIYGTNQGNTKSAFDTNVRNKLDAYTTRQGAWKSNADVALQEGNLGWNIASGSWDRNFAKARQGYEDEAAHNAAVAAAANANASAGYQNELGDYMRARDEFWTNQDRQYAVLDREADRGMQAANAYGGAMMGGYGAMGDYAVGAGDARAGATAASGNAWGNAISGIGNTLGGMALYAGTQPKTQRPGLPSMPPATYGIPGGQLPGTQMGMPQAPNPYASTNVSRGWSNPYGSGSNNLYAGYIR